MNLSGCKIFVFLVVVLCIFFSAFGDTVLDSGDGQYGTYGGTIVSTNYTDAFFTDPVSKVILPAEFDTANLNLESPVDISSAVSFDVYVYGDGSGSKVRFSFYVDPYDGGRLYENLTVDFTGWQHFSFNFADMLWYTTTEMTKQEALQSSIGIFQINGDWNGVGGTIYIDDATVCEEAIQNSPSAADIYNEHNNIVNNPYAEKDWQGWYHSANAQIANFSHGAGTKSFRLNPSPGIHSDVRSVKLIAEPGQKLKFKYSYKSSVGASIDPGSSYAQIRFLNDNSSVIDETLFELGVTNGQWESYSFEDIAVPNGTENLDIRFIAGGYGGNAQGQFYLDDIYLYQELPRFKSCDDYPTQLYVIKKGSMSEEEFVLIQSLQGLLAQVKPEIYIDMGNDEYLLDLQANHGVSYVRVDSMFWFMNKYSGDLDGYILADLDDPQSIVAATSISGILNGIIVDESLESWVISFGLNKLVDTRGKDCVWAYNNYWDQLNKNGIVVKTPDRSEVPWAYYSIDWYIAQKLLWWWNDSESLSSEVYDAVIDSSFCYGWNDAYAGGELGAVEYHSQFSLYTGAGTSAVNKSTLAGMANKYPDKQYKQPISDVEFTKEPDVHYVAFNMSDMDNIGVHLNHYGWHTETEYFANPHRGEFPMGWGMPATYVELAPTVMEYWYREATTNDSFIVPGAGLGYMYPSSSPELYKNTRKMAQLMERADLKNVMILDNWWDNDLTENNYYSTAHYFSRLDQVRGMFYVDVNGDYARYGREADAGKAQRIYWFDGKPMVPCRYTLWDGGQYEGISRNAGQLAASINALPTDTSNPASYTFVVVHAWSYGIDEVYNTIQQLDGDVRVVTPEELIEQIYMNLTPCGTAPKKADINNDCEVDFKDYVLMAEKWLTVDNTPEDFTDDEKVDLEDLLYFQDHWLK